MTLPLHLHVAGWRVLVVGAGPVGRRRVEALLAAGARVRWVAPDLSREPVVDEPLPTTFQPDHVADARLAFACAPPAVNDAVVAAARARGVLVGRADAPDDGDFAVPALLRRGPLLVALTSGAPAATAALRRALEAHVPAAWGRFAELVLEARARLADAPDRAERLRALANGPLLGLLEAGDEAGAERWAREAWRGDPPAC